MLALPHCRSRYGCMQVIRSTNNNGVEIFFLLQKLAEIVVSGASMVFAGPPLRAIVCIHDLLTRLTAGDAARYPQSMAQLNRLVWTEPIQARVPTQQLAHRITEFVCIPLGIARTALIDIADGNALHIGLS